MAGLLPADAAETVRKAWQAFCCWVFSGASGTCLSTCFSTAPRPGCRALSAQLITCVGIAIFFGYAQMKTCNIWVAVIMHYLNNNLVAVIAGSADVISGQVIAWRDVLILLILNCILFVPFIFTKIYGKKEQSAGEEKLQ